MKENLKLKIVKHSGNEYRIVFDMDEGVEMLEGINGHPDPFALEYPSMLDIGIMGHCINKCSFCYQGDKREDHMTFENFKKIIDESKRYTNQCALGGRGDPNLHPQFIDIIQYARKNFVVPNYTTSGNGLTQEQILASKKYCGAVAVSDYDKEYTYSALNRLIEADVKTNIHFLLSSDSFSRAIDLLNGKDIWNGDVNLDKLFAVIFLLFKPQGRGKKLDFFCLSESMIKTFSEVIKNPKTKFMVGMDSCLINKIQSTRPLSKDEELCSDTCEGARMSCYITPNMMLVPCSFGPYEKYGVTLYNHQKLTIKKAWNERPFKIFRTILKDEPACCPFEILGDI